MSTRVVSPLLLFPLLLLVACSAPTPTATPAPSPTATAMPTATSTPSPTPAAAPAATPRTLPTPTARPAKGSTALISPAAPEHLDVHQTASESLLSLGPGIVYSRLMRLKTGPDVRLPSLQTECDLCKDWTLVGPRTYRFRLRSDVSWQDVPPVNGRALTPQDVVFSLERLMTPGWPGATLLQSVASVEAVDEGSVRVLLKYADADFLLRLAHGQAKIVAPEAVAASGDLKEGPTIGTGPWVMDTAAKAEGYTFVPNPRYYERGVPGLERFQIRPGGEATTRLAMVMAGRADITVLDEEGWAHLQERDVPVERHALPRPGTGTLLALRADSPPFDDVRVRRALFQAIDPWQASEKVWSAGRAVGVGVPAITPDWTLSEGEMRTWLANPGRVGDLLGEAGVNRPVEFTLTVADFGEKHLALGETYRAMMENNGFAPVVERLNPRVYAEEVWAREDFQAFLGPMPPVSTPNSFLLGVVHSKGRLSITGYESAELDRLIDEQSVAAATRKALVRAIQERVLGEAVFFMPARGTSLWAWRDRVEGLYPNPAASEYFHWARMRVSG